MKWIMLNIGLLSSVAVAGDWSSYDNAFTPLVCSDGLVGCVVDGERVEAGTSTDSEGRYLPANMRINFFTLEATSALSPFEQPSPYEPKKIEEPEPEPEPTPVAVAPREPEPTPAPVPTRRSEPTPAPEPEPSAAPPVPEPTPPPVPEPTPPPVPEPTAAPPIPEPTPPPVPEPTAAPPIPKPVAVSGSEKQQGCDNLTMFETNAMMGTLSFGAKECLNSRAANTSEPVTVRARASTLLITDAQTRGDNNEWERLVKRHLKSIEKSQPDMCLSYALYLSQKGASRASQVIKWSEVALTNKHLWSGDARVQKVNALYQLRAYAANSLWQLNEQKLVKERSAANQAKAEDWRGKTKNFSREWLDFARAAGSDTSQALQLCVSAAGDKDFCQD